MLEVDAANLNKRIGSAKDSYSKLKEGDSPCKHIYEYFVFGGDATHIQTKAIWKYSVPDIRLRRLTVSPTARRRGEKDDTQVFSLKNASAARTWLRDLLLAAHARGESSKSLRSETWGAKSQMDNSGEILASLIDARESFNARSHAARPDIVTDISFGPKTKKAVNALWKHTPLSAQTLSQDALVMLFPLRNLAGSVNRVGLLRAEYFAIL